MMIHKMRKGGPSTGGATGLSASSSSDFLESSNTDDYLYNAQAITAKTRPPREISSSSAFEKDDDALLERLHAKLHRLTLIWVIHQMIKWTAIVLLFPVYLLLYKIPLLLYMHLWKPIVSRCLQAVKILKEQIDRIHARVNARISLIRQRIEETYRKIVQRLRVILYRLCDPFLRIGAYCKPKLERLRHVGLRMLQGMQSLRLKFAQRKHSLRQAIRLKKEAVIQWIRQLRDWRQRLRDLRDRLRQGMAKWRDRMPQREQHRFFGNFVSWWNQQISRLSNLRSSWEKLTHPIQSMRSLYQFYVIRPFQKLGDWFQSEKQNFSSGLRHHWEGIGQTWSFLRKLVDRVFQRLFGPIVSKFMGIRCWIAMKKARLFHRVNQVKRLFLLPFQRLSRPLNALVDYGQNQKKRLRAKTLSFLNFLYVIYDRVKQSVIRNGSWTLSKVGDGCYLGFVWGRAIFRFGVKLVLRALAETDHWLRIDK